MSSSKPLKSFVKSRFPRATAAYQDALQALIRPSLEKVFSEIYHTNAWQDPESVSGRGSTLARAKVIMSQLPSLLQELHAKTLLDAACGDFNWMRHTDLGAVNYVGVDVVPELIRHNLRDYAGARRTFLVADITKDRLPDTDTILCRDCLIHLSYKSIRAAFSNFTKTGATHLLCTTHNTVLQNKDCPDGSWRSVNLQLPPFNLPRPLKLIVEDTESGKSLGLWLLADLHK